MHPIRSAILIASGLVAATASGSEALAQSRPTPPKWGYELRDGKRVPKNSSRVTKADGSWREETRQGKCITVKERSASGEYKETRQCDGG